MSVQTTDGAYDVVVASGGLGRVASLVADACPAAAYAVITDANVDPIYGDAVVVALETVGPTHRFVVPPGEATKSRTTWADLTDRMLAAGVGRDAAVIALGGGVVGDLAGFVAATFHRGLPYVQVPTTLLAMIDSAIGGKTGVDTDAGKNLVGAFHQPRLVVADVDTLATLPREHVAAGMAEAVKHGAIADAAYFEQVARYEDPRADLDHVVEVVRRSVAIKADVVAADAREQGRRAVLNFGHTVGHALETLSRYALLHGHAVALGMIVEARLGAAAGITAPHVAPALADTLGKLGLPTTPDTAVRAGDLWPAMRRDKKNRAGTVRATWLADIGQVARGPDGAWTHPVEEAQLTAALHSSEL